MPTPAFGSPNGSPLYPQDFGVPTFRRLQQQQKAMAQQKAQREEAEAAAVAASSTNSSSPSSEASSFILAPLSNAPGYASESKLLRGLQVPARHGIVSSSFAYPSILARSDISPQSWSAFTSELKSLSSLSQSQWLTTVGKAGATLAVGSLMIGFFAAVPAAVVGKKSRRNREVENLVEAQRTGRLAQLVQRWNAEFFHQRGLVVRVDLPGSILGLEDMDVFSEKKTVSSNKKMESAMGKGRIVIIPLVEDAEVDGEEVDGESTDSGYVQRKKELAVSVREVSIAEEEESEQPRSNWRSPQEWCSNEPKS
ncbi:hypothetical protein MMC25_000346 [Agyrium rufum]|nr:hypothetical protein [Agyrium rufum]